MDPEAEPQPQAQPVVEDVAQRNARRLKELRAHVAVLDSIRLETARLRVRAEIELALAPRGPHDDAIAEPIAEVRGENDLAPPRPRRRRGGPGFPSRTGANSTGKTLFRVFILLGMAAAVAGRKYL